MSPYQEMGELRNLIRELRNLLEELAWVTRGEPLSVDQQAAIEEDVEQLIEKCREVVG